MSTSVLIRIVLIVITAIVLVVYRKRRKAAEGGSTTKLDKKKAKALAARTEKRQEARRQALAALEKKRERTSQTLKIGLEGLQQKVAEIGDQKIWYLEGGAGPGRPTVLLLHGFAGTKEDWSQVGKYLVLQKLHVVAPDLPGFGQNLRTDDSYDVTQQTKRIRTFLRHLGLAQLHLAGCSVGGSIAAAYAYSAKDDVLSLTLVEPFGVKVPYETDLDLALARGLNPLTVVTPEAYDNLLSFLYAHPPEINDSIKQVRAEATAKGRDFYLKMWPEIRGGERAHLLDLLLPEVAAKTLVVQGEKSRVVHPATAEIIRRMMKDARAVTIPDCGHFAMAEKPREVATHLLEFLGRAAPSGGDEPAGGTPEPGVTLEPAAS